MYPFKSIVLTLLCWIPGLNQQYVVWLFFFSIFNMLRFCILWLFYADLGLFSIVYSMTFFHFCTSWDFAFYHSISCLTRRYRNIRARTRADKQLLPHCSKCTQRCYRMNVFVCGRVFYWYLFILFIMWFRLFLNVFLSMNEWYQTKVIVLCTMTINTLQCWFWFYDESALDRLRLGNIHFTLRKWFLRCWCWFCVSFVAFMLISNIKKE